MKLIKVILAFTMMTLMGGCQMKEKKKEKVLTREEVKQEMMDYLTNKYHEEFEINGMDYASWYNGYIETMYAYPKGGNENYYFFVQRKGKNKITDDYVRFTMQKIYDEKARVMIAKYFPDAYVRVGIANCNPVPQSFRPDMSFEEFQKYANKSADLGCSIYLVAQNLEDIDTDKIEALKNELEQLNAVGYINFFGYSAEAFERYIVNDPFDSVENNQSYSTNGQTFYKSFSWGEIDFDYEYEEE